jgi:hypothetical protein
MFRRKPTKTKFGKTLLSIRESSERQIARCDDVEDPNRIVLLSASAGATVGLGGYGALLIDEFAGKPDSLPDAHGNAVPDRIVQFADALNSRPDAIEAAYRVATWALVCELAAFYWRHNYTYEMHECAKPFEFRNVYEGEVPALGEPRDKDASVEELGDRKFQLVKGSLVCMIGAALDEPIDWDDVFVSMHFENWRGQFNEALSVASERTTQLAPDGLPIWED